LRRVIVFLPVRGFMALGYFFFGLILTVVSVPYYLIILRSVGVGSAESLFMALAIPFLSLLSSPVNLVLKETSRPVFTQVIDRVYFLGITILLPRLGLTVRTTLIAINVGGALIPSILSLVLMSYLSANSLALTLASLLVVSLIVNRFSKVIPSVGIVTPGFIPPLISTVICTLSFFWRPTLIIISSYVCGVLGSLIGADLLNLRSVLRNSPPIVSIGGMGTFDGIYLTGVLSVFISFVVIDLLKFL